MAGDKAGALLLKRERVEISDALALFSCGFALHADNDAAVGECFRQSADAGNNFVIKVRLTLVSKLGLKKRMKRISVFDEMRVEN